VRALSKKYIVLGIIALVLVSPLIAPLLAMKTWKDDFNRTELGGNWTVIGSATVTLNGTHLKIACNGNDAKVRLNKTAAGIEDLLADFKIEYEGIFNTGSGYTADHGVRLVDEANNYVLFIGYRDSSTSGYGSYIIDQNGTITTIASTSNYLDVNYGMNISRDGSDLTVIVSGDKSANKTVTETHDFTRIELYAKGSDPQNMYFDYFYLTYAEPPTIHSVSASPGSIQIGESVKITVNATDPETATSNLAVKLNITGPKGNLVVQDESMIYNSGNSLFEYFWTPQTGAEQGYYNISVLVTDSDGLTKSQKLDKAFTVGLIVETEITITSCPLEVNPSESFTIEGYLKLIDGSALANRTVVISWLGVDYAVKTDNTGKYTKTLEVPEDTATGAKKLVAKFLGDGAHLESSTSRYVFVISSSTISKYTSYLWLIPDYLADLSGLPSWLIGIGIILLVITAAGFIIGAIKQIWKFLVVLWILYMFFALLGYI